MDSIGGNFDTVVKKIASFQDNLNLRYQLEDQLENKIAQQHKELSNTLYSLDTAKKALEQLDILKARNNQLELLLDQNQLENQKIINRQSSELEEKLQIINSSNELI
jgi:hypothetical protein